MRAEEVASNRSGDGETWSFVVAVRGRWCRSTHRTQPAPRSQCRSQRLLAELLTVSPPCAGGWPDVRALDLRAALAG